MTYITGGKDLLTLNINNLWSFKLPVLLTSGPTSSFISSSLVRSMKLLLVRSMTLSSVRSMISLVGSMTMSCVRSMTSLLLIFVCSCEASNAGFDGFCSDTLSLNQP